MADETLTADLLLNAKQGDAAARNRLFERYQPRILKIVRMMMGDRLRRQLDSQDLVQDTVLEACRRLDRFEPRGEGSLLRWLKALAHSAICAESDRRSAQKRAAGHEVSMDADDSDAFDPAANTTAQLDKLARSDDLDKLELCIAELPERQRDLILLRNYAEESWAEIAAETGHPSPDAARMAYAEAKASLASRLRSRGVGDQSGA